MAKPEYTILPATVPLTDMHPVTAVLNSPLGLIRLTSSQRGLVSIEFDYRGNRIEPRGILQRAATQLAEYFDQRRTTFSIPLDTSGTRWQEWVWKKVRGIPYGSTATYGQIARELQRPGAARAVGLATGCNPLPIITPCHRVVGATGALTGYRGGLERKSYLLQLESSQLTLFPT